MPKSKRNQVVNLTKTDKKDKSAKAALIQTIQDQADQFQYIWVFEVEHMRTVILQEVRTAWKGSRIFMGRNAVMRKALGAKPEDECRLGAHKVANLLEGNIGLLFTDEEPSVVTDWFETFKKADFARSGNLATETFVLPEGPVMLSEEEVAPHSLEPQLRKLGLSTSLIKGVPTLSAPHTVCKQGDKLNSNQVQLLKLFSKPMATFQLVLKLCVRLADGASVGGTAMEEE